MSRKRNLRIASMIAIGLGALSVVGAIALVGTRALEIRRMRADVEARWAQREPSAIEMIQIPASRDLAPYWMDKTEVTVDAYAACVAAGVCTEASTGSWCNAGKPGRGDHPINCVDHRQASAFCAWTGRRLPTAREWGFAACGHGDKLPWGESRQRQEPETEDSLPGCYGRFGALTRYPYLARPPKGTCPVTAFPSATSPAGLLGMADNVAEWTDTEAPPGTHRYVNLGGDWTIYENYTKDTRCSSSEMAHSPNFRGEAVGFRCARSEPGSLIGEALQLEALKLEALRFDALRREVFR